VLDPWERPNLEGADGKLNLNFEFPFRLLFEISAKNPIKYHAPRYYYVQVRGLSLG